jgi:hypothetical protein
MDHRSTFYDPLESLKAQSRLPRARKASKDDHLFIGHDVVLLVYLGGTAPTRRTNAENEILCGMTAEPYRGGLGGFLTPHHGFHRPAGQTGFESL